jgi:hypothetical protein
VQAAAVLLAFSLFNIYFAQETRMYTLLTFNAAIVIYALVRLSQMNRELARLDKPVGRRIVERIRWLAANQEAVGREPWADDLTGLYKLRVGD